MTSDVATSEDGPALHGIAGTSARAEADERRLNAAIVAEQCSLFNAAHTQELLLARRYDAGADGELTVWSTVRQHLSTKWHLLADRRWPGTKRANIDLIAIGPAGVFVIDAKNWADPRIADGQLFCGDAEQSDEMDKLRAQVDALSSGLSAHGLSPNEVHGVIVLAHRKLAPVLLSGHYVVGEASLATYWAAHGARLSQDDVERLVAAVDQIAPPVPHDAPAVPSHARAHPPARPLEQAELLTVTDVLAASRRIAEAGTIESWMVWLDPQQAPLVKRDWTGPARIRGAAGTGKTVVALHRAAYLAKRSSGRVLVTSFVRTLPAVHQSLFTLVGPDVRDRVEFCSLHAWANAYVRRRGLLLQVEGKRARGTIFPLAFKGSGALDALRAVQVPGGYWWDEVGTVIKGRDLRTCEEYLAARRTGRRVPLQRSHREAVWALYEEYERRRVADGIADWNDLLLAALAELRNDEETRYDGVVVDEVQDLSAVGLRIVSHLTRHRPEGLLLVGDGQQAVYPGGTTMKDAGISVTGRSTVLGRNYRNGEAILRRAVAVVVNDEFDDLDEIPERGDRDLDIDRAGGAVDEEAFATSAELQARLIGFIQEYIESGGSAGACAVLCPGRADVETWAHRLKSAGIPAINLADYDGRAIASVKVGTYQRAKGLEFALVALPNHDRAVRPQRRDESEEAYAERAALERRQLFVAMTRARDRLWLGSVS